MHVSANPHVGHVTGHLCAGFSEHASEHASGHGMLSAASELHASPLAAACTPAKGAKAWLGLQTGAEQHCCTDTQQHAGYPPDAPSHSDVQPMTRLQEQQPQCIISAQTVAHLLLHICCGKVRCIQQVAEASLGSLLCCRATLQCSIVRWPLQALTIKCSLC